MRSARTLPVLQVLLIGFIFLTQSAPAAERAGTFRLADISVAGSKLYESKEIIPVTGLKVGETLTLDSLKQAANRLASTGVFDNVRYRYLTRAGMMTASFTVQDKSGLLPCVFGNFVWFPRQELMQQLRAHVPLFKGYVPPGGAMLDEVRAELEALLESHGVNAQVQFSEEAGFGQGVKGMEFQEVGVPLPVQKIVFTGAQKIDPSLLQAAARPLIGENFDAPFVRNFVAGTISRVYQVHGYLRVRFGEPVPRLLAGNAAADPISVTVPVSEGQQYRLKGITWSGESAIPYPKLAKSLHAAVGRPVNAVELEQGILGLLPRFHRMGYLMADATPKATLNDATGEAVYQVQIHQGDIFRLGKLEIAGVDASTAQSLVSLSKLQPGDIYAPDYWHVFFLNVVGRLPRSASGWKFHVEQAIHPETKTVDVQLVFSPAASL